MVTGIIPARYASSRFPGKPLIEIGGTTMIRRVYEQALKANLVDNVIVATDDFRIFEHVLSWGGAVSMTSSSHVSGTDRCAEVAKYLTGDEIIVNIQGDEPMIDPEAINLSVKMLLQNNTLGISTLATKITNQDEIFSPHTVKVVLDINGKALYFSRSAIPYVRNSPYEEWLQAESFFKHIGIYAFRNKVLQEVTRLVPGKLEQIESLEQLRWMEAGFEVGVSITENDSISIDTPDDLAKLNW